MIPKVAFRNICLIAGDPSGDIYGARLIVEFLNQYPNCQFFGIGGAYMEKMGMELIYHNRNTAFMGFAEIIAHLGFIRQMFKTMLRLIRERKPDAVLLIDYPGFNLRMAQKLHRLNIPVYYYIAPQTWAWKEKRVHTLRRYVKKLFVIFPFEEAYFRQFKISVQYVGHPFGVSIFQREFPPDVLKKYHLDTEMPIIAMLPGSREQEIRRHIPVILEAIDILKGKYPHWQFAVSRAPYIHPDVWSELMQGYEHYTYRDNLDVLLAHSQAVAVASGTASLQVAFHTKPMVIFYKTSPLSYRLARHFTRIKHIGMINILNGSELFPELLQDDFTPERLAEELEKQILVFVHHPIKITKMKHLIGKLVKPDSCKTIVDTMASELLPPRKPRALPPE
ncbi:MAG TPA: lipid-A-disaccharide synthase [Candidatus Marinimicrobia bacterium]|nr:lipid-A-disaccharide synthase [Candidatus Neomarinimicrobiota bacterium]